MKLIPLSTTGKNKGKYFAQVDDDMYPFLIHWKWSACYMKDSDTHYAIRGWTYNGKRYTISMHRFIMSVTEKNIEVDHTHHNGLNNQIHNLRLVTKRQQQFNTRSSKKSTSKFKGVSWATSKHKWRAVIMVNRKQIFIGYFINEQDAANAYDTAAIKYFGELACLNSKGAVRDDTLSRDCSTVR